LDLLTNAATLNALDRCRTSEPIALAGFNGVAATQLAAFPSIYHRSASPKLESASRGRIGTAAAPLASRRRRNGESRNIYLPYGFTGRLMRLDSFPPIYAVAQAIIWRPACNQFNVIFLPLERPAGVTIQRIHRDRSVQWRFETLQLLVRDSNISEPILPAI